MPDFLLDVWLPVPTKEEIVAGEGEVTDIQLSEKAVMPDNIETPITLPKGYKMQIVPRDGKCSLYGIHPIRPEMTVTSLKNTLSIPVYAEKPTFIPEGVCLFEACIFREGPETLEKQERFELCVFSLLISVLFLSLVLLFLLLGVLHTTNTFDVVWVSAAIIVQLVLTGTAFVQMLLPSVQKHKKKKSDILKERRERHG